MASNNQVFIDLQKRKKMLTQGLPTWWDPKRQSHLIKCDGCSDILPLAGSPTDNHLATCEGRLRKQALELAKQKTKDENTKSAKKKQNQKSGKN